MIRWSANLVSGLAYYAKKQEVRKRYNWRVKLETDKFVEDMLTDENYGIIISFVTVENRDTEKILPKASKVCYLPSTPIVF